MTAVNESYAGARRSELPRERLVDRQSARAAVGLSIVTTLYHSAQFVAEFHRRMVAAAAAAKSPFEIVYVNDGSPDLSLEAALELARADSRVVVVDLSRNFGHHQAIMAGLAAARGELVFLIDVDLEERPEWLELFLREMADERADAVFGQVDSRLGNPLRRISGWFFYKLFNLISETPIPKNLCTVRLMTRRYVDSLLKLQDRNLFLGGNFAWAGFVQRPLVVQKESRTTASSYTLKKRLRLFAGALTSFSAAPLKYVFFLGALLAGVSALVGIGVVIRWLVEPESVLVGWASVMVSVWFLGGLLILVSGLIGYYIAMIFEETKHRPSFIVRAIWRDGREE